MPRGPAAEFGKGPERILIVEGVTSAGHVLMERLIGHGYEVDMAGSAREALRLAQTGRWDAVTLDIGLPDMNGVELYTQLNPGSGRECLPVIFVSGYTKRSLLQALRKSRGVSQLMKPFSVCLFLNTLEHCLQNGKFSASTQPW